MRTLIRSGSESDRILIGIRSHPDRNLIAS